jgi:hypothetical protein
LSVIIISRGIKKKIELSSSSSYRDSTVLGFIIILPCFWIGNFVSWCIVVSIWTSLRSINLIVNIFLSFRNFKSSFISDNSFQQSINIWILLPILISDEKLNTYFLRNVGKFIVLLWTGWETLLIGFKVEQTTLIRNDYNISLLNIKHKSIMNSFKLLNLYNLRHK